MGTTGSLRDLIAAVVGANSKLLLLEVGKKQLRFWVLTDVGLELDFLSISQL